ncbi:hypothetical protein MRX96_036094 [Rhipicephalus microplus]
MCQSPICFGIQAPRRPLRVRWQRLRIRDSDEGSADNDNIMIYNVHTDELSDNSFEVVLSLGAQRTLVNVPSILKQVHYKENSNP